MTETHLCSSLDESSVEIFVENDHWIVSLSKLATEDDLENNHYLEHEGELVEQVRVRISFCPYCGLKLASSEKLVKPTYSYDDYSGW